MTSIDSLKTRRPFLLLSLPRSGSTWAGNVFSRSADVQYVLEPCDAYRWSAALWAKAGLAEYPTPYDAMASGRFRNLWKMVLEQPSSFDAAVLKNRLLSRVPPFLIRQIVQKRRPKKASSLSTGLLTPFIIPPLDKRLFIKEVNVSFCSGVIADWLGADVIVLRREPKKVVASWQKIKFDPEPVDQQPWVAEQLIDPLGISKPSLNTHAKRLAWTVGLLDLALMREAEARKWPIVTHEQLLMNPRDEFEKITRKLKLKSTDEMWQFLDESGRSEGSGFSTNRTAEQLRHSSRGVFSAKDQVDLENVLRLLSEHLPQNSDSHG